MCGAIEAVAVIQFLRLAAAKWAIAAPVASVFDRWVRGINELARDFNATTLTVVEWQKHIETLNETLPLEDLFAHIDFERLTPSLEALGSGEHYRQVIIPDINQPTSRVWSAVYFVPKGDAIPPHGHTNLVTAHLILSGRLHTRTFDRVAEEPGRLFIRLTRDVHAGAGMTVSMSDDRDNVHWFVAEEGPAFTFDVGMLPPIRRSFTNLSDRDCRIYLDPSAAERADGTREAAVIDHSTSIARFGRGPG
jgi:hypothetical protein